MRRRTRALWANPRKFDSFEDREKLQRKMRLLVAQAEAQGKLDRMNKVWSSSFCVQMTLNSGFLCAAGPG